MKKVLIINGPNLNLLEKRDKTIYGDLSLKKVEENCTVLAQKLGLAVEFIQSNKEGDIVEIIQQAIDKFDAIIINAAAYTHTSVAIRDALEMFPKQKIEVHISNIYKREEFRHKSLLSSVVDGVICGFGIAGYEMALHSIKN